MVVINGREFNLTQIGPNRYLNNVKSAKEAQELAQLLRGLDRQVSVVTEGGTHTDGKCNRIETFFNYKPEPFTGNPLNDGIRYGGIEIQYSQKAFSSDYTANDALASNWASATGNVGFFNSSVKSSSALEMNQSEFLNYVRENGLDKAINWNEVSFGFDSFSVQAEDFTACTDYAAALYASVNQRINRDFTGEELEYQLDKLNSLYDGMKEKLSERYADNLERLYDFHGIEIPKDQITRDIASILDQKKDAYCKFVEKHEDYAGLEGNADKWLERDIRYMASELKNVMKDQDVRTYTSMSENDIIALGLNAKIYETDEANKPYCYSMSRMNTEESIGLAIAANYLQSYEICDKMNVSDEVRSIMEQTVDKYKSYAIENVNRELAFVASWEESNAAEFSPLDEEIIDSVIKMAKDSYNKSGDTYDSLQKTAHFAYSTYQTNAEKSGAERYHRRTDIPEWNFWQEFYEDGRGTSFLGKLLDKWDTFSENLDKKNYGFIANGMSSSYFQRYKSLICGLYKPM